MAATLDAPAGRRLARDIPPRLEAAIFLLIWVNVAALVLETVPALQARHAGTFRAIEVLSVGIFTVEYVVRLWRGGARFARSAFGIVDLLAILPFYLPLVTVDLRVIRIARSFRMYRLFQVAKLTRYSRAFQLLGRVIVTRRGELAATACILLMLLLVSSTVLYYAEYSAQPAVFSSIPATMWWAIATLTTVGYGDVVPVTATGKALGSIIAVLGIAMFALPTGILGAGFVEAMRTEEPAGTCPHCGR